VSFPFKIYIAFILLNFFFHYSIFLFLLKSIFYFYFATQLLFIPFSDTAYHHDRYYRVLNSTRIFMICSRGCLEDFPPPSWLFYENFSLPFCELNVRWVNFSFLQCEYAEGCWVAQRVREMFTMIEDFLHFLKREWKSFYDKIKGTNFSIWERKILKKLKQI
jgi:hypothetical protein